MRPGGLLGALAAVFAAATLGPWVGQARAATAPGAPQNVTCTPGNGQITVTWSAPANDGGAQITMYRVGVGGTHGYVGADTLSYVATGLTNGTSYSAVVNAMNAVGASTGAGCAATPATAPGYPGAAHASPGNGQATVTWTAPSSNGGSPITGYGVTSIPGGHTATVSPGSVQATVSGLTNGTAYTFQVQAFNSMGGGGISDQSNSVTPVGPPGPPTAVSATAGNAGAIVSWTPPSTNGGSAITGYTVTTSPGGATVTTTGASATVGGLTNGTSYTFTVTASNAMGTSPASSPSSAVVPATVPGTPTGITATGGDSSATVSWTPPAANGGAAITGYVVTASPGNATATTSGTSVAVTGLANGASYAFTVRAVNSAGTSPSSTASNVVVPVGAPSAPTKVACTPIAGGMIVSWVAPATSGGSAVATYTVTASGGAASPASASTGGGTLTKTFTGLGSSTQYTFAVTATNGAKLTGPPATCTGFGLGPPGPPTAVAATAGSGQATVSWTPPASNGHSPIVSYVVSATPGGMSATTGGTSVAVTGLKNGVAYTFTVVAKNAVASSPLSAPSAPVIPGGSALTAAAPPPATSSPAVATAAAAPAAAGSLANRQAAVSVSWETDSFQSDVNVELRLLDDGRKSKTISLLVTDVRSGAAVTSFSSPLDLRFARPPKGAVASYSHDGKTWTRIPELPGQMLAAGAGDGFFRDAGGVVHVLTRHATLFRVGTNGSGTLAVSAPERVSASRRTLALGLHLAERASISILLESRHGELLASWQRQVKGGATMRLGLPRRRLVPGHYVLRIIERSAGRLTTLTMPVEIVR